MEVANWKDVEEVKIAKFPYRGKPYDVKGISVRWLSYSGMTVTATPSAACGCSPPSPGARSPSTTTSTSRPCTFSPAALSATRATRKPTTKPRAWSVPWIQRGHSYHAMHNLSATAPAIFLSYTCNVYAKETM
jgi:hypothetical protein